MDLNVKSTTMGQLGFGFERPLKRKWSYLDDYNFQYSFTPVENTRQNNNNNNNKKQKNNNKKTPIQTKSQFYLVLQSWNQTSIY